MSNLISGHAITPAAEKALQAPIDTRTTCQGPCEAATAIPCSTPLPVVKLIPAVRPILSLLRT